MKQVIREEWGVFTKLLKEMSDLAGQGDAAAREFTRDQTQSHDDRLLLRYFMLKSRESDGASWREKVKTAYDTASPYENEEDAYNEGIPEMQKNLGIDSGLQSIDALRCLEDEARTKTFIETINNKVQAGDAVLEAGAGTGVLAIAAARKGATVEAVEINPVTAVFARRVVERCERNGLVPPGTVRIRLGDAMKYQPRGADGKVDENKKFDAYISENIYTGQFYELQIQINNALLKYVDTGQDKVIPLSMVNGCELSYVSDRAHDLEADIEAFVTRERIGPSEDIKRSDQKLYDWIALNEEQEAGVRNRFIQTAAHNGEVDSLTIFHWCKCPRPKATLSPEKRPNS